MKKPEYKVPIVNLQTLHANCGCGRGKTLAEAQADAMRIAKLVYADCNPRFSESGHAVHVDGGVNC